MKHLNIGLKSVDNIEVALRIETATDRHGFVRICIATYAKYDNDEMKTMNRVRIKRELSVGEESATVANIVAVELLSGLTAVCMDNNKEKTVAELCDCIGIMVRKNIKELGFEEYIQS